MKALEIAAISLFVGLTLLGGLLVAEKWENDEREPPEWSPENAGVRFAIMTDKPSYRYDEPILLWLILENVSDEKVHANEVTFFGAYRVEVRLPNGKPAPLTLEGQRRRSILSILGFDLKPGERDEALYPINHLFDMTLQGEYSITAYRDYREPNARRPPVLLPSNTIKVEVHERESAKQQEAPGE